jgi:hypothetical protein
MMKVGLHERPPELEEEALWLFLWTVGDDIDSSTVQQKIRTSLIPIVL